MNMKNIKKFSVNLVVCIILSVFSVAISVNAAPIVKQVNFKSVDNIDTTTQKITWEKIKNVSGYEIYYKSSGAYKKLATVGKTKSSYTINKLDTNIKYFYKIRAYKTINGKRKYGKFSSSIGKKTTNYLMNLYEPYYVKNYNGWYYTKQYKSPNMFSMGGEDYTNGFELACECSLIFNLKGKYNTITFTLGTTDNDDRNVAILADDETVFTTTVTGLSLPKTYTVNIENASKLEFRDTTTPLTGTDGDIGFANIRLYK